MAGKSIYWRNVQVQMESTIGTPIAVTEVTKASEAVATIPGHALAVGDWGMLTDVQGMYDLNYAVVRIKSIAGDDVTFEGEDTTLLETFISGNLRPITYDTDFSTLLTFSKSGGEFPEEDDTTIHDNSSVTTFGTPSATVVSAQTKWLPDDPALKIAKQASKSQEIRAGLVIFQNGSREAFAGEFATLMDARGDGSPNSKVTSNLQIAFKSEPRYFAN